MNIKQEYCSTLETLENTSPIAYYDNIQLNDLAMKSRLSKKWNTCDSWDLFIPNHKKPYSILNNESSSKKGEHWIASYQTKKTIYIYDSFARTQKLMQQFVKKMNLLGFKVVFVNKKKDQPDVAINCGLRCLLWLIFCNKYGLTKARRI